MTGKTHVSIAVASGVLLAGITNINISSPTTAATYAVALAFGGILPDIDHSGSKVGSKVPIIPHLLKHRGFTHSLTFLLAVFFLLNRLSLSSAISVGLLIGIASHLVSDSLTPAGIQVLWPLSFRLRFPIVSSKIVEGFILWGCNAFIFLNAFNMLRVTFKF